MKLLKFKPQILLLFCFFFMSFTLVHKYYVSLTQIHYIKDKNALQITSRIFIDDLETLFSNKYQKDFNLASNMEIDSVDQYYKKYLKETLHFSIDGITYNFNYLGKEYETDAVTFYLEIENIPIIKESISIENKLLLDAFDEQQNYTKIKALQDDKTHIFTKESYSKTFIIPFK